MADTFEFEVDGESYDDIEKKAFAKAQDYFGSTPFLIEVRGAPDRHLPDSYHAEVTATAWRS